MDTVYVAGHKNPDMDCVCSAYCYAALKRKVDPDTNYQAIRSGPLSGQIRDVFELAGVSVPEHFDTIAPTVGLVAKPSSVVLKPDDPVLEAIREVESQTISAIPIIDEGGEFRGVVGVNEITSYILAQNRGDRPIYSFLVENLERTLPGEFIRKGEQASFDAPIVTGSMPEERALDLIRTLQPPPMLVIGNRREILAHAVEMNLPAIVVTGLKDGEEPALDVDAFRGSVYRSGTDTAETIRLLRLSSPVRTIMDREVPRLQSKTPFDRAKADLIDSKYRGLPVFDGETLIGMVTRRSFIERPRRKLIMVDHNEVSQAVDGAHEALILEIVDHHRLAPPSTTQPIAVTTRAVGSTCTLVYEEFANRGLALDQDVAILLLSGIVSDTVNLHSPTTTEADRRAIHRLESITGISAAEHAKRLFAQLNALENREPREIVLSDFKKYDHAGISFGIGQVEVTTLSDSSTYRERLLEALSSVSSERSLAWTMIMVTDVIKRNSLLLTSGYDRGERHLPFKLLEERTYDMPGVLSRKKQLLPEIMRVLSEAE
jgi:manganese-dependent inorganic pyrophosphatase